MSIINQILGYLFAVIAIAAFSSHTDLDLGWLLQTGNALLFLLFLPIFFPPAWGFLCKRIEYNHSQGNRFSILMVCLFLFVFLNIRVEDYYYSTHPLEAQAKNQKEQEQKIKHEQEKLAKETEKNEMEARGEAEINKATASASTPDDRAEHCVRMAIKNGFRAASCASTFINSCVAGDRDQTNIAFGIAKSGGYLKSGSCGGGEATPYDAMFSRLYSDF